MKKREHRKNIASILDNLDSSELLELLLKRFSEKNQVSLHDKRKTIPISIFKEKKLSILECIVKYLKENCRYKYSQIAKLLNRDDRTIWTTYNNAVKKNRKGLHVEQSDLDLPVDILSKDKLSALESISVHLKDKIGIGFTEIAKLLDRSPKTIWTSYMRAKKK